MPGCNVHCCLSASTPRRTRRCFGRLLTVSGYRLHGPYSGAISSHDACGRLPQVSWHAALTPATSGSIRNHITAQSVTGRRVHCHGPCPWQLILSQSTAMPYHHSTAPGSEATHWDTHSALQVGTAAPLLECWLPTPSIHCCSARGRTRRTVTNQCALRGSPADWQTAAASWATPANTHHTAAPPASLMQSDVIVTVLDHSD
jgi:hypothetical protein